MKRYALHLAGALNVALLMVLAFLWFTPTGAIRNSHWSEPQPHTTDFLAMVPPLPKVGEVDTRQFLAMLDKPLFSPTRRPPPPPPPPAAAAPVDNLSTARLSGVFQGSGTGGVILNIAGKDRRVHMNESIEGWALQSIQGRTVTFAQQGQTRVLQLPRALLTTYTGLPPAAVAPQARQAPRAGGAAPAAAFPQPGGASPDAPKPSSGPSFGVNRR